MSKLLWGLLAVVLLAFLLGYSLTRPDGARLTPQVISLAEWQSETAILAEVPTGHLLIQVISETIVLDTPESQQVLFVLGEGRGRAISGAETYELTHGEMLIVFAGTPLRIEPVDEKPFRLLRFVTPPPGEGAANANAEPNLAGVLRPLLIDVRERFSLPLEPRTEGVEYASVFQSPMGSVGLVRVDGIWVNSRGEARANLLLYALRGRAAAVIGAFKALLEPGWLAVVPARVPYELMSLDEEPTELIVFATPPFD